MKETIKIMQRDKVIIQYYLYCPICNKEITGITPKQVEGNIKQHLNKKHERDKQWY